MPKSTDAKAAGKADRTVPNSPKPYPRISADDAPDWPRCKKTQGRLHYFDPLDDPDVTRTRWESEWDDRRMKRSPIRNH